MGNKEKKNLQRKGELYGEVRFLIRQRKITYRQIQEKKNYYSEVNARIDKIMAELEKTFPEDFTISQKGVQDE